MDSASSKSPRSCAEWKDFKSRSNSPFWLSSVLMRQRYNDHHPLRGAVICSLWKEGRGSVEEVHQWYVDGDYGWQQDENQSRHRGRQKPYPRRLALGAAHPYINAVTQGQKSKRRQQNGSG